MPHFRPVLLAAALAAVPLATAGPTDAMALLRPVAVPAPASASSSVATTTTHSHLRRHVLPTRTRVRRPSGPTGAPRPAMKYHGGPVMTGPIHVYVVWYGNWAHKTRRRQILTDFIANLSGPRFAINTTYPNRGGIAVDNDVTLAGQYVDRYSVGRSRISDDKVGDVVANAIRAGKFPSDPSGIYLVLTSNDVGKPGFLTQYCGWHTFRRVGNTAIKFAFVGDPTGPNLPVCGAQRVSPNGDAGADSMASVIAHEVDETVSDPELNGWYDEAGEENADRCAWTYGRTFSVGRAKANVRLGSRSYLIQRNWLNTDQGGCVLALPNP